jgi:replicative DNA helicase
MHVHHLRGSSAIDYESDIVLIMNNKYKVLSKEHIAYNLHAAEKYRHQIIFSVEKNRSGPGQIDLEYDFYGPHFCFNPQGRKVEQRLIDEKIIKE